MAPRDSAAYGEVARFLRRRIIEQSLASQVGHVGSALSIADIVAVLWQSVMRAPGTAQDDRDRFVLGKGHAALALYAALLWRGLMSEETFRTYCGDDSLLGAHPERSLPGVDVSTGSLGLGLSIGCGLAYAFRLQGRPSRVFALLSDAECNEGQVWEAAQFAAHHRLASVCAIVDVNGLQALGYTRDILALDLRRMWEAAGWETLEVDGHDGDALLAAFVGLGSGPTPRAVLARTVLGKGVSFMENRLEWHYRNLTPDLAAQALRELESGR